MRRIPCLITPFLVTVILFGCGGKEITEPVPLEPLVIFKANVTKPSALYETSETNEEDQFYFLEKDETVEVLQILYPGGSALVRTDDGEEGWCPDIAMEVGLMTETFADNTLSARYPGGAFEETAQGVVGWVTDESVYYVTAAASGDFTGSGKAETAICEAVIKADNTAIKTYIIAPETYRNIAETEEYCPAEKGIVVEWVPVSTSGHTAISLSAWGEESVETPLRLKKAETTDIWLYDGEMKKTAEIITVENIVTIGAAAPDNITKGDFTARFFWQRLIGTEFEENREGYYEIKAVEKVKLYCSDDRVFEYESFEPAIYRYDDKKGYVLTSGKYFNAPLSDAQTINEPARLRRQPADAGDPIRIIEAGEQVEIILAWPELVETERGQAHWYYVYYQTKESEEEYAGWLPDKYFE